MPHRFDASPCRIARLRSGIEAHAKFSIVMFSIGASAGEQYTALWRARAVHGVIDGCATPVSVVDRAPVAVTDVRLAPSGSHQ